MIRVNVNEQFPVTVSLVDETAGDMGIGETVYYDMRVHPNDALMVPAVNGILPESSVEPGVYSELFSISTPGRYIVYTTASGFSSGAEDIIVEEDTTEENLAALIKQNRHYNLSVEDVTRENPVATASQTIRKVALGNTDYIVNRIKQDTDPKWATGTVTSGIIYAWYRDEDDSVPYLMGDDGL